MGKSSRCFPAVEGSEAYRRQGCCLVCNYSPKDSNTAVFSFCHPSKCWDGGNFMITPITPSSDRRYIRAYALHAFLPTRLSGWMGTTSKPREGLGYRYGGTSLALPCLSLGGCAGVLSLSLSSLTSASPSQFPSLSHLPPPSPSSAQSPDVGYGYGTDEGGLSDVGDDRSFVHRGVQECRPSMVCCMGTWTPWASYGSRSIALARALLSWPCSCRHYRFPGWSSSTLTGQIEGPVARIRPSYAL